MIGWGGGSLLELGEDPCHPLKITWGLGYAPFRGESLLWVGWVRVLPAHLGDSGLVACVFVCAGGVLGILISSEGEGGMFW